MFTGHGLDAPQEGLHVFFALSLVLVEIGPGSRHVDSTIAETLMSFVTLDFIWKSRFGMHGGKMKDIGNILINTGIISFVWYIVRIVGFFFVVGDGGPKRIWFEI